MSNFWLLWVPFCLDFCSKVKREAKEMEMWVFVRLKKRQIHRTQWMKIERKTKERKSQGDGKVGLCLARI